MKTDQQLSNHEKAKFSLSGATLYGINAVIGSGIFLLPQRIYGGLGPASLLAMVIVAALVLMLALCFAEVAGYFDKNGGAFQYSKAAFGDFVGFNVGLLGWVVVTVAWAAMASGFARIFIITFPQFEGYDLILSISLVVLLSLMNIAGLRTSKIFTLTITVAKLIPIIAFAVLSIFFISGGIKAGNFTPFLQLKEGLSLQEAFSSTAITVFYAFIGFETLPIVAGEMRNAKSNVPRAIIGSNIVVTILYMLIIAGTIAMIGGGIMDTNAPVQDAFVEMIGPAGKWLVSIGALISITGLNVGESIMVPRYGAAVADEGLLPAAISKQNDRNAPVVAILISCAVAVLCLLSGSFETLATLSVVIRFFQYIPTAWAVVALRKKKMDTKPVFRVPFGPVIPILAITISVWMVWSAERQNLIWGVIGVIVASIVYKFFIEGRNFKEKEQANE